MDEPQARVSGPSANVTRLADLIRVAARRQKQAVAVEFEGETRSYEAFCRRSLQLCAGLQGFCARGDRIAIFARNCIEYLELYAALQIGGFVAVPVNYRLAAEELLYIVQNSGARALVVEEEFLPLLEQLGEKLALAEDAIVIIGRAPPGHRNLAALIAGAEPQDAKPAGRPLDPAAIYYTSGTTGFPKGAVLSQLALLIRFCSWGWKFGITDEDTVLVPGPVFHQSFCSIAIIALCMGGKVVLQRDFEPDAALRAIGSQRITWSFLVPKMLAALVERLAAGSSWDLSSVRTLLSSGATLPQPLLAALRHHFPGARLCDAYGWTESGWITISSQEELTRKERSVGRPTFGCELAILDPEGNVLGPGETGRICAANPVPFLGYHANPAATAAIRFGKWEASGDIGYLDDDGYLFILDRERDVIISGGENIYPAEIERVLVEHPDVAEVAVVGVPDQTWGETPRACVVVRDGHAPSDEELIAYCAERIARYKRPRSIARYEALPRNSMGKVLRRELRAHFWTEGGAIP